MLLLKNGLRPLLLWTAQYITFVDVGSLPPSDRWYHFLLRFLVIFITGNYCIFLKRICDVCYNFSSSSSNLPSSLFLSSYYTVLISAWCRFCFQVVTTYKLCNSRIFLTRIVWVRLIKAGWPPPPAFCGRYPCCLGGMSVPFITKGQEP